MKFSAKKIFAFRIYEIKIVIQYAVYQKSNNDQIIEKYDVFQNMTSNCVNKIFLKTGVKHPTNRQCNPK